MNKTLITLLIILALAFCLTNIKVEHRVIVQDCEVYINLTPELLEKYEIKQMK